MEYIKSILLWYALQTLYAEPSIECLLSQSEVENKKTASNEAYSYITISLYSIYY